MSMLNPALVAQKCTLLRLPLTLKVINLFMLLLLGQRDRSNHIRINQAPALRPGLFF